MAGRAPFADNVSVSHIEYHSPLVGTMRIVACSTIATRHGVIHVGCLESELISFMALFAKSRNFASKQIVRFHRGVGIVAI